jgi:hypothetical protein
MNSNDPVRDTLVEVTLVFAFREPSRYQRLQQQMSLGVLCCCPPALSTNQAQGQLAGRQPSVDFLRRPARWLHQSGARPNHHRKEDDDHAARDCQV